MKFAVTYCVTDREVGSNPLGHSCILLSQWDELGGKIEVVDQWGFYGVPSTDASDSWLSKLKIKLGLDLDLQGNHGMLRHEEVRFMDLGRGLHGVTFELTQDQFKSLQQKCADMAAAQEKAIQEIVAPIGLKGKAPAETRIYPHEQWSAQIFALEKARAQQEGRPPRLKSFELNLSMTFWGPDLNQSHTCKSQVVSLLEGILSPQQINRLTVDGKHRTVPMYSGNIETIFLHSCGPLNVHKKGSGEKVYYRDGNDPEVKLYWTLPPQEIEALSADTANLLKIPDEYRNQVKSIVSRLQRVEWLFINAELPSHYQDYQKNLINRIRQSYETFAKISPKKTSSTIGGWQGFFLSLLSAPRDEDEADLQQKIKQAQALMNSLYLSVVDHWEIDENCSSELQQDGEELTTSYYNPLEAVASRLKKEDKEKLCNILKRNYIEPEPMDTGNNAEVRFVR